MGVSMFVLSCITSLPWTTRLSLDFFNSRVSVSAVTELAGDRRQQKFMTNHHHRDEYQQHPLHEY